MIFSAKGITSDRITINSNGHTDNKIIANSGATIWLSDIDGVEVSVSGSGKTADIRDSRILNVSRHAVTLNGLGTVRFYRNFIDNAAWSGVELINIQSTNRFSRNTITNCQFGIRLNNSEIEHFTENVIENSSKHGIVVWMGSYAHLTDEEDEDVFGYNRFKDNQGNQIQVHNNDYALLGDQWFEGLNSVYHSDPEHYDNSEYITNLNTSATIKARHTWWGTTSGASSAMFKGAVDYSDHSSYDYTVHSGSPLAKTHVREEQKLEDRLLDLISELESDAWRSRNDHRLSELYIYMRTDRNDKMGLRDKILGTISEWSSLRSVISSAYDDSHEVRRAVETAMLLEIRLAFRNSDYERAGKLNDAFDAYIELEENRLVLLNNEVSLHIHHRGYAAALNALGRARALAGSTASYDRQSWDVTGMYLQTLLDENSDSNYKQYTIVFDKADFGETRPESFTLEANYPNPFKPVTTIPFTMIDAGQVRIEVYDLTDRRVAVLTDRMYEAGRHNVS